MPGIWKSPQLLAAALLFATAAAAQSQGPTGHAAQASSAPPIQSPTSSNSASAQGAAPPAAPPAVAPVIPSASATLRPALDQVQTTLFKVHTERWKRGSVRDEAGADIGSIKSDIQSNMASLLHDADGAPGSLSKMLPVAKHIDALYDVLLRVVEASRMAAPDDQADALRQALSTLGTARLAFDDQMQLSATTQEKQMVDLRATVQKQAAFKCPVPPPVKPCPSPVPAHPVHKRRPAAPTTTDQQKPAPASQQKPAAGQQTQKPATTTPNKPQ